MYPRRDKTEARGNAIIDRTLGECWKFSVTVEALLSLCLQCLIIDWKWRNIYVYEVKLLLLFNSLSIWLIFVLGSWFLFFLGICLLSEKKAFFYLSPIGICYTWQQQNKTGTTQYRVYRRASGYVIWWKIITLMVYAREWKLVGNYTWDSFQGNHLVCVCVDSP